LVGCTGRPTWTYIVMVTYRYAYMTYIVSPLAGLSGGISWRPPAHNQYIIMASIMNDAFTITVVLDNRNVELRIRASVSIHGTNFTA